MGSCLSQRNKRPQLISGASGTLTHNTQVPGTSGPSPECAGQEQGKETEPEPADQPQHGSSSSGPAMHTGESEETVITSRKSMSLQSVKRSLMTM
ncbi:hypothetical protein OG21DRAFT_156868 [Imleria badia]|nr:hypothetical protein OG21DRAFT_156868 [Imleria badia]